MTDGQRQETRKGMAIASLVLGILGLPTVGLLGLGALAGIVLGVMAVVKASNEPALYGGKGLAIAGIVTNAIAVMVAPFVIGFLGIVAAIAIPSVMRARVSANESSTIGDLRTVIAAEAAYQSANVGYFDTLDCLATPARCIPGYSGPPMLEANLAQATLKHGYRRTFHPGPAASTQGELPAKASPSSLMAFAYVAVPDTVGQSGVRSFCGDSTGRICHVTNGSVPAVVDGACPADCTEFLRE